MDVERRARKIERRGRTTKERNVVRHEHVAEEQTDERTDGWTGGQATLLARAADCRWQIWIMYLQDLTFGPAEKGSVKVALRRSRANSSCKPVWFQSYLALRNVSLSVSYLSMQ